MRAIKFRAWDATAKEPYMAEVIGIKWFYVNESYDKVHYGASEPLVECAKVDKSFGLKCHSNTSVPLSQVILMQFTGLHDKNGKEIWEGDVVRWQWIGRKKQKFGPPAEVKMATLYEGYDNKGRTGWIAADCFVDEKCEVLGNIYENPELLNEK